MADLVEVTEELSEAEVLKAQKTVLGGMPDNFVECRSYGYHAWKPLQMFRWRDPGGRGICRISKCSRCGTVREDYYTTRGELASRRYDVPSGYATHGLGRMQSDAVMRELFTRSKDVAASREDAEALVQNLASRR